MHVILAYELIYARVINTGNVQKKEVHDYDIVSFWFYLATKTEALSSMFNHPYD